MCVVRLLTEAFWGLATVEAVVRGIDAKAR
jgi:hypothetical protein